MKPKASDRDVGRAKADEIDQLIDISEILKSPPRPVAQYAIAAALFVAGLAWAVIGGGTTDTLNPPSPIDAAGITVNGVAVTAADEPIEIDLNEPIQVEGLDGRTVTGIEFEQFGLPIGDAPSELVTLGPPGLLRVDSTPGSSGGSRVAPSRRPSCSKTRRLDHPRRSRRSTSPAPTRGT